MTNTYYDELSGVELNVRPDAFVHSKLFDNEYFLNLQSYLLEIKKNKLNFEYDVGFGRSTHHSSVADPNGLLVQSHEKLLPIARKLFNNPDLEKSYCIYSVYRGYKARLFKHIDDNACTYTIDLMIHYKTNWPLVVEGQELIADENEAIVYYGEDQYHWRPRFPDPKYNEVGVIFYHFVDKDHWFFTGENSMANIVMERNDHRKKYSLDNSFDL